MGNITTVLFDLGGVLVELGPVSEMMASSPYNQDEIWRNWIQSPAVREFESGQSSPGVFARSVVDEYQLQVSPEEFLRSFLKWPVGAYSGAAELLAALSSRFRLACLSNTNEVHWDGFLKDLELVSYFETLLMSHETGHLKPDEKAF